MRYNYIIVRTAEIRQKKRLNWGVESLKLSQVLVRVESNVSRYRHNFFIFSVIYQILRLCALHKSVTKISWVEYISVVEFRLSLRYSNMEGKFCNLLYYHLIRQICNCEEPINLKMFQIIRKNWAKSLFF